jgi:hypothetical protein
MGGLYVTIGDGEQKQIVAILSRVHAPYTNWQYIHIYICILFNSSTPIPQYPPPPCMSVGGYGRVGYVGIGQDGMVTWLRGKGGSLLGEKVGTDRVAHARVLQWGGMVGI